VDTFAKELYKKVRNSAKKVDKIDQKIQLWKEQDKA